VRKIRPYVEKKKLSGRGYAGCTGDEIRPGGLQKLVTGRTFKKKSSPPGRYSGKIVGFQTKIEGRSKALALEGTRIPLFTARLNDTVREKQLDRNGKESWCKRKVLKGD